LRGFLSERKRQDFVSYGFVLNCMGGDNSKGRKRYGTSVARGLMQDIGNLSELGKRSGIAGDEGFV